VTLNRFVQFMIRMRDAPLTLTSGSPAYSEVIQSVSAALLARVVFRDGSIPESERRQKIIIFFSAERLELRQTGVTTRHNCGFS